MYFEHFTERAKRTVFFANVIAQQQSALAIEPEHLLSGLLREDAELFLIVIAGDSARLETISGALADGRTDGSVTEREDALPLSLSAKDVIRLANDTRAQLRHNTTGTDHLLLFWRRHPSGAAGLAPDLLRLRFSGFCQRMASRQTRCAHCSQTGM